MEQGNVTVIHHDTLAGYIANEHIDWTGATTQFSTSADVNIIGTSTNLVMSSTGAIKFNGYLSVEHFVGQDSIGLYIDYDSMFVLGDGTDELYFEGDTITASTNEINLDESVNIAGTLDVIMQNDQGVYTREYVGYDTLKFKQAIDFKIMTNGDMVDGFGTCFRFLIQDSSGVEYPIARVGAMRDGADDSGIIRFDVWNAGVKLDSAFAVDKIGDGAFIGNVSVGSSKVYKVGSTSGVSGSFTTSDSKTVTVIGGIITSIAT